MSGKIIAVCGSPNTGKTTVAVKIAERLCFDRHASVIYVSPDQVIPAMAYLFPTMKAANLHSLGAALDKAEVLAEDVEKEIISPAENFGFLGYKSGENKYTYPALGSEKVILLFGTLTSMVDYVVVDCTCAQDDKISSYAKRYAESIVRMISPDLKCMAYYASNYEEFEGMNSEARTITAMSICDSHVFYPVDEIKDYFGGGVIELPYSDSVKSQALVGIGIPNNKKDYRKYMDAINKLVSICVGEKKAPVKNGRFRRNQKSAAESTQQDFS